jgi:hypothetical protein
LKRRVSLMVNLKNAKFQMPLHLALRILGVHQAGYTIPTTATA